jgi:GH25 family lysozyme M1 (1,4-beta-N-acetylmuramidase)
VPLAPSAPRRLGINSIANAVHNGHENLLAPSPVKRRRKLQPLAINPLVVDLSHHNDVANFGKVKASVIAGIIHKATEATGFADDMYAVRRGDATNAGLLWGAYHFLRPVSISAQVDFFLKIAAPDKNMARPSTKKVTPKKLGDSDRGGKPCSGRVMDGKAQERARRRSTTGSL